MNDIKYVKELSKHRSITKRGIRFQYKFQFDFKSKEQYLEFVTAFKALIKELSQKSIDLKSEIKDTQRSNGLAGASQYTRLLLQQQISCLLQMRAQAKIEAQKQYLVRKAELVVA